MMKYNFDLLYKVFPFLHIFFSINLLPLNICSSKFIGSQTLTLVMVLESLFLTSSIEFLKFFLLIYLSLFADSEKKTSVRYKKFRI